MLLPPIIQRELRVALRRLQPRKSRLTAAAIGAGVSVLFLLIGLFSASTSWGRSLHGWLFLISLNFVVIRPAQACLGLFCDERRSQTFDLLYMTGISSADLFAGKLIAGMLVASSDFMALIPFLALPFLSGGVSLDVFLATIVYLPLLLFFIVTVSLLASVICSDESAALIFTIALVSLLCLATPLPYALGKSLTGAAPFSTSWLWLSPAYGALAVGMNFNLGIAGFWPTAGFTFAWAVVALALARKIVPRTWRSAPDETSWNWHASWQSVLRGTEQWRGALRSRLLELNPFQWLAQRDRRPVVLAWLSMALIGLIWIAGWCAWPNAWPSAVNFFITATLLLLIIDGLNLNAAARRIAEDRREGMLELLLTTPLSPLDILEGQLAALRAQFRPVRRALFGLFLLLIVAGFVIRTWNVRAIISYLLIWSLLLAWCVSRSQNQVLLTMWVALISGRSAFSVFRAQGGAGGFWWVWIMFNLQRVLSSWGGRAPAFPKGTFAELVTVLVLLLIVVIVVIVQRQHAPKVRTLFVGEMRRLAQEPVPDRNDPRFQKWKDLREPFPE